MLRQKPSIWSAGADTEPFLSAEADCIREAFTVTGLPSCGVVLKADGQTEVNLGETLTASELAALNFLPASRSGGSLPSNSFVIYAPRNGGRIAISPLAGLPAGSAADMPVTITELPSNGAVFLADGMTAVAGGREATDGVDGCGNGAMTTVPTRTAMTIALKRLFIIGRLR